MTEIVLVLVIGVAALVYVFRPVRYGEDGTVHEPGLADDARERKHAALGAILDLEEEHAIGKLERVEYEALRARYEADAAAAIAELESLDDVSDDDDLEAEIAAMRERMTCPRCGALRAPDEQCPSCNAPP